MSRITGSKSDIDERAVLDFFADRAQRFDPAMPEVSMLYQDKDPDLAVARSKFEIDLVTPLLNITRQTAVLDIGCGIGRWADAIGTRVSRYVGTDMSSDLVEIAQARHSSNPRVRFETLRAQDTNCAALSEEMPFDLVIVAGVLHYINDADCVETIRNAAASGAHLYIRGPIAIDQRLTLQTTWSEDLDHSYSAIYRTLEEMNEIFREGAGAGSLRTVASRPLLPPGMSNRRETAQHFWIFEVSQS